MDVCLNIMRKKWEEGSESKCSFLQPSPTYPLHSFFVEAPAVSIARSKRAIGQATPTLVGSSSNADNNATRDVTSMLVRGGMSIHVERTSLVPSLCVRLRTQISILSLEVIL